MMVRKNCKRRIDIISQKKGVPLVLFLLVVIPFLHFSRGIEECAWRLEEVLSIGSLEDDVLFQWVGIDVDGEQNIYVTDALDYSLKKFDAAGRLLKKEGRKGQGPGEFLAPRYLDSTEEFIYVSDQFIPRIQVFDKNLNYRHSVSISIPVSDFSALSNGEIAVVSLSPPRSGRIFIFDSEGQLDRELQYSDEKFPLMMDMVNFTFGPQGYLHLAYNFQDKIEKFDLKGKKLWSKNLLGVKKVEKEKIASLVLPSKLIYKDIVLDNSENIFILGGSYSRNPSRDVYVLNPEGQMLTVLTLPDSSHCIHIDSQGFLYSRANEGVTLKKFKIRH